MIDGKGSIYKGAVVQPVPADLGNHAGQARHGRVWLLLGSPAARESPAGPAQTGDLKGRSAQTLDPALAPRPRLDLPDKPVE